MMSKTDCEKYEAEERIRFITKRDRDRHHKHQLDELPTFLEKIDYWRREVFPEKEMALGRTSYRLTTIDSEIDFELELKPQTDEERQMLFDFSIECDRRKHTVDRTPVNKSFYNEAKDGSNKVAFYVESFDDRKKDLAQRLSTAVRKRDLLEEELRATTAAIDALTRTSNSIKGYFFDVLLYMRQCLATHKQFDFNIKDDRFWSTTTHKIGQVWDIVHYEAFLKDQLYILDHPESRQFSSLIQPSTLSVIELEGTEELPNNSETPSPILLYIRPGANDALYQDLCGYLQSSDHEALRLLLYDNVSPQEKLVLTCMVGDLAATFHESGAIIESKKLSEQLPNYFVRNERGKIVSLKVSSLEKLLAPRSKK